MLYLLSDCELPAFLSISEREVKFSQAPILKIVKSYIPFHLLFMAKTMRWVPDTYQINVCR